MARPRFAPTPRRPLFRLGLQPDPLAWPPWRYVGDGRFDDPQREFRVLSAAVRRRTVFVESCGQLRPTLRALAAALQVRESGDPSPKGIVPAAWWRQRALGCLQVLPGQRWLDLRSLATREHLRRELAALHIELGLHDFDLAGVLGQSRQLTQTIARWAYEHGAAGIVYPSRLHDPLTCWAIFESAAFAPVGEPEPITPDDPDFVAVARIFDLTIEQAGDRS